MLEYKISDQGIWLLVDEQEYFMPFTEFPWFVKAVEVCHTKHVRWPSLDIDVAIDSLTYPEAYPLKYS